MQKLIGLVIGILLLGLMSCSNFEKEELWGHWKNADWEFIFNEDKSCKVGEDGQFLSGDCKYQTLGNSMEISCDGIVLLSGVTIKSLENDELKLEFRNIIGNTSVNVENIQLLKRVN